MEARLLKETRRTARCCTGVRTRQRGTGNAVLDGVQKSITTQARAVSICLAFARRVINGKELKEPRVKESAAWRHYERKKEILTIIGTMELVN